jgi:hypothetical protein
MKTRDDSSALARFATAELKRVADPRKAPAMAAYMKTSQPFFGVPTPLRTPIERAIRAKFEPGSRAVYERGVLALWTLPHREERYLAIATHANGPTSSSRNHSSSTSG